MRRLKTLRRPPIYPKTPGHLPCSSLTHPLPLSSRRPSVSFGGFGLKAADGRYAVPHGFRSSFRDWAAEKTDAPHAVMEAALAHVVGNSTEAAYFRSDLFDRRRALMTQWADYLG